MSLFKLLPLIVAMIFVGCGTNEPQPYKYVNDKLNYNKLLEIPMNKSKAIIYIDNRFDIDRKNRFIKGVYEKLLNTKIRHNTKSNISSSNSSKYIEIMGGTKILINSHYERNYCILFCDKTFQPNVNNMKMVKNGILIKDINSSEGVRAVYRESVYLKNIFGILGLKLNIESMENGIAFFSDEYLKKYSLKNFLEKELKEQGYKVTNNLKKANLIFSVENLAFYNLSILLNEIRYPINYAQKYSHLKQETITDKYYELPIKLLSQKQLNEYFLQDEELQFYIRKSQKTLSGSNKVSATLAILSALESNNTPFTTVNSVKIFHKGIESGKILNLTISKDTMEADYQLGVKQIRYNTVLSDKLIENLNEQAAKQVLSKIKFINEK